MNGVMEMEVLTVEELDPVFDRFTQATGFQVTDNARAQIVHLINCVVTDPHPTWTVEPERLGEYFRKVQGYLPHILQEIARKHRLGESGRITSIDVVYWVGTNLKHHIFFKDICPFPDEESGPTMNMVPFPWNVD